MRGAACLLLPLLVSACTDMSRGQCQRAAVEEIRTLDRLIAETEAGIARGYGIDRQDISVLEEERCGDAPTCFGTTIVTEKRPVALDPPAEERKLAALREARQNLIPRAMLQIADCRRRFPETQ